MVQWWEHSPPTNVARVRFPVSASYVGWVCCWFSSLLREVFLRVLRFFSLHKDQHFQIPVRSGNSGWKSHSVGATEISILFIMYLLLNFDRKLKQKEGAWHQEKYFTAGYCPRLTDAVLKFFIIYWYTPLSLRCTTSGGGCPKPFLLLVMCTGGGAATGWVFTAIPLNLGPVHWGLIGDELRVGPWVDWLGWWRGTVGIGLGFTTGVGWGNGA